MGLQFRHHHHHHHRSSSLPRVPAQTNPLSAPTITDVKDNLTDPLRRLDKDTDTTHEYPRDDEFHFNVGSPSESSVQIPAKEWISFRKILLQRFPISKMISVSSISSSIMKSGKVNEKSTINTHLEELNDPQKFAEEGMKVISQQDYVTRLHELKEEITHAWHLDDRVKSLKLSIKVGRLLMDTSVEQFYPKLFLIATDIFDVLGELVWERIKQKAISTENGSIVHSFPGYLYMNTTSKQMILALKLRKLVVTGFLKLVPFVSSFHASTWSLQYYLVGVSFMTIP